MNVASRELCAELYELSGWIPKSIGFTRIHTPDLAEWELVRHDMSGKAGPAYDLGYLLRKLPKGAIIGLNTWGNQFFATVGSPYRYSEGTPEDAAAKLAIELYKQGILK